MTVDDGDNIIVAMGETIDEENVTPHADGVSILADGSSVGPLNVGTGVEGRCLSRGIDDGAFNAIGGVTPLGTGKSDILYFNPDDSSLSVSSTDLGALSVHGPPAYYQTAPSP